MRLTGLSVKVDFTKLAYLALYFGATLAMVISWSIHKSIMWATIHGVFGWGYVFYYWYTLPIVG